MKRLARPTRPELLPAIAIAWLALAGLAPLGAQTTAGAHAPVQFGGGFKYTNPNAKASCSCGESFSL